MWHAHMAPLPGGNGFHHLGCVPEPPAARAAGFYFQGVAVTMRRVACFVDGFNLYHAIDDLNRPQRHQNNTGPKHHLKWLDLWSLAESYLQRSQESLTAVFYFSAYATWLPDAFHRHRQYVAALQQRGVQVVLGNFKEKRRKCLQCGTVWTAHEEKESDVNLAVHLLHHAHLDTYDKALILTADTDLVPAIQLLRADFPAKNLTALIPQARFGHANALRQACHHAARIDEARLGRCLLPERIEDDSGKLVAQRPGKYQPPTGV